MTPFRAAAVSGRAVLRAHFRKARGLVRPVFLPARGADAFPPSLRGEAARSRVSGPDFFRSERSAEASGVATGRHGEKARRYFFSSRPVMRGRLVLPIQRGMTSKSSQRVSL